jgi:hypothetical protein
MFFIYVRTSLLVIPFSFRIETHGIAHFTNNWHQRTNNNTVAWRVERPLLINCYAFLASSMPDNGKEDCNS